MPAPGHSGTGPPLLSVALISAAALAYEILLMRLFSISQWHHFAHMTISLALLGFGASGTFLVFARRRLLRAFGVAYTANLFLFGVATVICFALAQRIRFNPEEMLWDGVQWLGLLLIYLLLALPFLFAGNGLGLALVRFQKQVPRVYASDLVGAGLGGVGAIGLLYLMPPGEALRLTALCAVAAAAVGWFELRLRSTWLIAVLSVFSIGLAVYPADWSAPVVSQFKGLSQTLQTTGARIVDERTSPLGLLQIVESHEIPFRHAPGLSLMATAEPPGQVGIFTDAGNMTAISRWHGEPNELEHLEYLTSSLPFAIAHPQRVLVLGAGGGAEVLQALRYRTPQIDAVEVNPQILELVRGRYGDFSGGLYDAPGVRTHVSEAREYLAGVDPVSPYDLVELSLTDSFAASSAGLYALNEGYLYTIEAMRSYLGVLAPGGLVSITRWIKIPPRDTLKMFATAVDALTLSGVHDPGNHLILIRGLQTSTLLVKNSPLTQAEISRAREFCANRAFDLAWYPGMPESEANRLNILSSPHFHTGARALLGEGREGYLAGYKFDLQPVTDDRPYFYHFFKWSTLREVLSLRGRGGTALLDAGYLMLIATLVQTLLASAFFVLLPLAFLRPGGSSGAWFERTRVLLYFFLIGLAFFFLEIAFIQKFVLFLHHPVYAVTVVLAAFLVFAGAGSAVSGALGVRYGARRTVQYAVATMTALCLLYLLTLDLVFTSMLSAPVWAKIVVSAGIIAPLGASMGIPFPQALDRLGESVPILVPWAWAINGCASVVSAVLATLLAIHFGFTTVIVSGLALYVLAVVFFPR